MTELHGIYYHTQCHFGVYFEAKVANEVAEFFGRYDPQRRITREANRTKP